MTAHDTDSLPVSIRAFRITMRPMAAATSITCQVRVTSIRGGPYGVRTLLHSSRLASQIPARSRHQRSHRVCLMAHSNRDPMMKIDNTTTGGTAGTLDLTQVFAQAGDTLADVAQRYGVSEAALHAANPGAGDVLLTGEALRLPSAEDFHAAADFHGSQAGVVGGMGREAAVQVLMGKAYEAGHVAPQEAFDSTVYRAVPTKLDREQGALDHTKANSPNRYRSATERVVYTSPDPFAAAAEARPYAQAGKAPMADSTLVGLRYTASPDARGNGGVADLAEGARRVGLPVEALVDPKGNKPPSILYQLTGEHPYSLGQQAAKGAADAGASGIRAPSAETSHQINIFPRNTHSDQVVPETVLRYDAKGVPGLAQAAHHVRSMPPNDKPVVDGPLSKWAGDRKGASVRNQGAEDPSQSALSRIRQWANNAAEGYPRANSGRYGAVGGAVVSLAADGVAALQGKPVTLGDGAVHAGSNMVTGYTAARAADKLLPSLGPRFAGGVVASAIESVVSTGTYAQAYRRGDISAARATANIAVDAGTALAAGGAGAAAGAAAGATAGTVVLPLVGTAGGAAVGAVVGFVAGTGTYLAVHAAAQATGVMQAAKDKLAGALVGAERPLGRALDGVGRGLDAVGNAAGKAWDAVKFW